MVRKSRVPLALLDGAPPATALNMGACSRAVAMRPRIRGLDRATRSRTGETNVSGQRANRLLMRRDWTIMRFALRASASNERGSMLSTGTNATRAQPRMPCARVAHDCLLSVDASRKISVLHV